MTKRQLGSLVRVLALLGSLGLVVVARVVSASRAELHLAEAALAQRDVDAAIVHERRAARWYAPFNPYSARALTELARIGAEAERNGDRAQALLAYRSLRGAIMATRGLYVPQRARLAAANGCIARLITDEPPPGVDAGKSKSQIEREHLALLARVPGPNVFWTVVLLFGFFAWIAAAFAFSLRAIDAEDRWVWPEVQRWGVVIALGFGLFVLGMLLA
ncbi:MAG TPA: hypothetical protein VGI70_10660 [Polyangiales bacterium]